MPAPISKDSMSRCEAPSMLYDTIRRPNAPYIPPKAAIDPAALSKDTIATTQQKLNREVMERFQNTSSRLSHHSFVVVAQAGKYLFLAIMLPPYICFFGIPRWLLMNALPQLFVGIKTETLRIGKFLSELSKRILDTMKGVIEQLIGDSLKMFNQQSKNLFEFVSCQASHLSKNMLQVIQKMRQSTDAVHSFMLRIKNKIADEFEKIQQKIENLKNTSVEITKTALNILFYPFDLADRHIFKPASMWAMKKVNAATNGVKKMAMAIKNTVKRACQPLIFFLKNTAIKIYNPLHQLSQYVINQAFLFLQPYMEMIRQATKSIKDIKEKISREISRISSALRAKTKEIISTTYESVSQNIQVPLQLAVQFLGWAWWHGSQWGRNPWGFFKKGAHAGKKAFKFVGNSLAKGAKSLGRQARWLAKGISQGFYWILKWIIEQLVILPSKILLELIRISRFIVRMIASCIYASRIIVAWVWVLSSCGMMLVRELANEIGSWFRTS